MVYTLFFYFLLHGFRITTKEFDMKDIYLKIAKESDGEAVYIDEKGKVKDIKHFR